MRPIRFAVRVAAISLAGAAIPSALGAQQTVALENGDRLSGTVVRIEDGSWILEYAATSIALPAAQIASLTTADALGLRLADGTIMAATVAAAAGGVQLTQPDGSQRVVALDQIEAIGDPSDLDALVPVPIGLFHPITRFWGANASFGLSDKSGNSRARGVSGTVEVARRSPKDRLTFRFGLSREESEAEGDRLQTTVSKYYGSGRADIFISAAFFVFVSTRQERDRFQDISLRSTYNGGMGWQAITKDATDLRFSVAIGARREAFISGGHRTAAVGSIGPQFRQDVGPAVFSWQSEFLPNLQEFEDFRFVSDASVTLPIYAGLGVQIGVLNEFNNQPQPGVEKHDMLVTTRLSYSIGP